MYGIYPLYKKVCTMEFAIDQIQVPSQRSYMVKTVRQGRHHQARVHAHSNFELNFVLSGEGRMIIGNQISSFRDGDLILLGPYLSHSLEHSYKKRNESECIVVYFSDHLVNSGFASAPELKELEKLLYKSKGGIRFRGRGLRQIRQDLLLLRQLEGLEGYIRILKIFNDLLHLTDPEELSPSSKCLSKYRSHDEKITLVHNYVISHLKEDIKLDDVATLLHMAPASFCRYFKKVTNMTFIAFVKQIRIETAAKMLSETDEQVSKICFESGYNSLTNFYAQFKSIMKQSPSDYRSCFR